MAFIDLIGWVGSGCLIACGVPQLCKTYKTRNIQGLSLSMLILWTLGLGFMLFYTLLRAFYWPLIANYGINIIVTSAILYLYLKERFFTD